jgi:hypothetical protein
MPSPCVLGPKKACFDRSVYAEASAGVVMSWQAYAHRCGMGGLACDMPVRHEGGWQACWTTTIPLDLRWHVIQVHKLLCAPDASSVRDQNAG